MIRSINKYINPHNYRGYKKKNIIILNLPPYNRKSTFSQ